MDHAATRGLVLRDTACEQIREDANPQGKMHDSRDGGGIFYRYQPRDLVRLCEKGVAALKPNGKPKGSGGKVAEHEKPKVRAGSVKIHSSVMDRLQEGTARYAPGLLPERFVVAQNPRKGHRPPDIPVTSDPKSWKETRERVLAQTTRRSGLYHLFFYASIALVIWMLYLWANPQKPDPGEPRELDPSWTSVEGLLDRIAEWSRAVFQTLADGLNWALPKATEDLVNFVLVDEPIWLVGLLALGGGMFALRGRQFTARDRAAQDARKIILEGWSKATQSKYVLANVKGRVAARPVRWQTLVVKTLALIVPLWLLLGAVRLTFQHQDAYGSAMSVALMVAAPFAAFGLFSVFFRMTGRNPGAEPLNQRKRGYDVPDVIADWSERDLAAERRFLIVDLLFPPVYGAAFAYSLYVAARYLGWSLEWWHFAPIAVFVIADWIENSVQLAQLGRFVERQKAGRAAEGNAGLQEGWIRIASAATIIKWWGVSVVGFGGLLVLSGLVICRALGWV